MQIDLPNGINWIGNHRLKVVQTENTDMVEYAKFPFEHGLFLIENDLVTRFNLKPIYEFSSIPYSMIRISADLVNNEAISPNTYEQLEKSLIHLPKVRVNYDQISQQHESQTFNVNADILGVFGLWDMNIIGSSSVIAVVDTGIDFTHPNLEGKMFMEKSFKTTEFGYETDENAMDLHGHGTAVASLIAGNDTSLRGIAYGGKIVNVKVGIEDGFITSASVLAAMDWAASIPEVDIINLSLGEPEESPIWDVLELLVNRIVEQGKIVVASAGNNGKGGSSSREVFTIGSPGSSEEAITVGAVDGLMQLASFSSEGPSMGLESKPDIVAPGVSILAARLLASYNCETSSCYVPFSGTSFSTPLISGVMGLLVDGMKKLNQTYSVGTMKSAIIEGAQDLGIDTFQQGFGLVNASKSYRNLLENNVDNVIYAPFEPFKDAISFPVGEKLTRPLTVVAIDAGAWQIQSVQGLGAFLLDEMSITKYNFSGFTHNIPIVFSSGIDDVPGNYSVTLVLLSPDNRPYTMDFVIKLTPPAEYRILLDLAHSPWDSMLGFSSKSRVDRLWGKDIQGIIQLLGSRYQIWIEEFFGQELTAELLIDFDLLWMPSVFSVGSPNFFDHDIQRPAILTPNEVFAINQYKKRGGNILIDFGGLSDNDVYFETVLPDRSSLLSLASIFGFEVSNLVIDQNVRFSNTTGVLPMITPGLSLPVGLTELLNGIPLVEGTGGNYAQAFVGENSERAIMLNSRNWRSSEYFLANTDRQVFAEAAFDFLFEKDGRFSWDSRLQDGKIEVIFDKSPSDELVLVSVYLNGTEKSFSWVENSTKAILTLDSISEGLQSGLLDLQIMVNDRLWKLTRLFHYQPLGYNVLQVSRGDGLNDPSYSSRIAITGTQLVDNNVIASMEQGTFKEAISVDTRGNEVILDLRPSLIDLQLDFVVKIEIIDFSGNYYLIPLEYATTKTDDIASTTSSTFSETQTASQTKTKGFLALKLSFMLLPIAVLITRRIKGNIQRRPFTH